MTDNGIGIKEHDKPKLFQLFGFIVSTKELNSQGIGLGLHISKKIIQEFGGDISFESQWGQGTSFTFVIALDQPNLELHQIRRIKNPIKKSYSKISINRQIMSDQEENLSNDSNDRKPMGIKQR